MTNRLGRMADFFSAGGDRGRRGVGGRRRVRPAEVGVAQTILAVAQRGPLARHDQPRVPADQTAGVSGGLHAVDRIVARRARSEVSSD